MRESMCGLRRAIRLGFGVGLLMVGAAQAASFDCAKAQSTIEKMICADAELSKLDESLAAAYVAALKASGDTAHIRQRQKQWLKERNACDDAACVKNSIENRIKAEPKGTPVKVSYIVKSDKDWVICGAYTKALNTLPVDADFPYCSITDLKVTGVSLPKWEVMNVEDNLPLLHQMELVAWHAYRSGEIGVSGRYAPPQEFKTWDSYRRYRVQQQEQMLRLRKVRMPLVATGPTETLLAYDGDIHACKKSADWDIYTKSYRDGEATSPMKRLVDQKTGQLIGDPNWDIATWGEVILHQQIPYLVLPNGIPGNTPELIIKRFENSTETRPENLSTGKSGYLIHELCRIVRTVPLTSPLSTRSSTQSISR